MKNKHLVLLAVFGLLGLWFFQKWPFERKNQLKSSFLEYPIQEIKALSFSPSDDSKAFELRYTSEWVLTKGSNSYQTVDSVVNNLIGSLALLDHGHLIQLNDTAELHAVLSVENAEHQRIKRRIYKTNDSKYVVRILKGNPASYLLYDDYPLLDRLMEIEADSFRNPTILTINPTDVVQISYLESDSLLLFMEKKMDEDSVPSWIGQPEGLDLDSYLSKISTLPSLPFDNSFAPETEPFFGKKELILKSKNKTNRLTIYELNDSKFSLISSDNDEECFQLPDTLMNVVFPFDFK